MAKLIRDRQLLYLFLVNLVILFDGMGLFPILPLYARKFGATSAAIGLYLGITYAAITAGTLLTGWLAGRFSRKVLLVATGVPVIPALFLLGHATALWQITILTAAVWFFGGIGLALVTILTGLHAEPENRGKAFGLLFLGPSLGAILGGTVVGRLVEWQGYALMFAALALISTGWPLLALSKVKDAPAQTAPATARQFSAVGLQPGKAFFLLLAAALLAAITVSIGRLGTSLSMSALQFSPGDVAGATVAGGLVTMPVVLLFGTLSDALGRKRFLLLSYLLTAAGALVLISARDLWQFWLASSMLVVGLSTGGSLASALATDILSPDALSHRLPWIGTANGIASMLGFAGAGLVLDALGATGLFAGAAMLSGAAIVLVGFLPGPHPAVHPRAAPEPVVCF